MNQKQNNSVALGINIHIPFEHLSKTEKIILASLCKTYNVDMDILLAAYNVGFFGCVNAEKHLVEELEKIMPESEIVN